MRSPRDSTTDSRGSRLIRQTEISPRYPASTVPGAFTTDTPDFAASPEARLDFFYWRHPAADRRYRVYPVARLDVVP